MMENTIEHKLALKVKEKGGKAYYVGGFVRDLLLGIDNKDVDVEIHGIDEKTLLDILKELGEPLEYGSSFGVYSLKGENVDIALPRKEVKTGVKHTDFDIVVDPNIGTYEAARRRDFTINALMKDILSGEIVDHFNGQEDLKNRIIKHVDDITFKDDPLRVLRAAQFASRFEFEVDKKTIDICSNIDLSSLTKERVEEELKKALLKADKPSIFFNVLKKMNKLDYWFKEINNLDKIEYETLMNELDEASRYRFTSNNPYLFMLYVLSQSIKDKSKPFFDRLTNNNEIKDYISNMLYMYEKLKSKDNDFDIYLVFDESKGDVDLINYALIKGYDYIDAYGKYKELLAKDYIKGQDLIDAGFNPGSEFKKALEYAHKLRLQGIDKNKQLELTIEYLKKTLN